MIYNCKKIICLIITIFTIVVISSCKFGNNNSNLLIDETLHPRLNESYDTLYFLCDSIKTKGETRKIYNSFYDTIVIEKGIFSYLTYNYEQSYCENAIALTRSALLYEKDGQTKKAKENYYQIIFKYLLEQSSDKERIDFSDCDVAAQYAMNSALLCSNAYYKVGKLDKAIEVLAPVISCHINYLCRIHYKFIQLYIIKYGKKKVAQELYNCVNTAHFKEENTCDDGWLITIFGSNMSLNSDKLSKDANLTPNKVTELLKTEEFSSLIK